jgi:hypothetical protein
LYLFNYFGAGIFGFTDPLNCITAVVVGFLWIPGLIPVIIFHLFVYK